jgi:hypothetical protein
MKRQCRHRCTDRSRAVVTVAICAAILSGLAARGGPPLFGAGQGGDSRQKINRVGSVSELRASTAEDRALATHFDRQGMSLLEAGSVRVPPPAPVPIPPPPPGEPQYAPPDPLPRIACASEAIVVGHAVSSRTLLNQSETFLITVYEVAVGEWIRPSKRGGTLSVAMLGGDVLVDGELLSARVLDPLRPGVPVLMFLRRVPGAPRLYAVGRPFPVVNGKISATEFLAGASLAGPDGRIDVANLMTVLRGHSAKCGEPK